MNDWEAHDYLTILGFDSEGAAGLLTGPPSPEALATIHRAHVERVPYETLDFQLGRTVTLNVEESVRRILAGRGGYCFMLNSALAALLTHLGYRVRLHRGGVQGRGQEPVGANGNHLALTVHDLPTPQVPGGVWFVDAGLGDALHEPLPLVPRVYRQGPFVYRLLPSPTVPGGLRFDHDPAGSFEGMDFSLDTTTVDSFSDMHHYLSTDPESSFVRTATAQRRHADGIDVLRGCVLRRTTADDVHETVAATPGTWFSLLKDTFGLHLADLAPADRERLWTTVIGSHERWVLGREGAPTP
jgi:N-hydroxyarylamine O-acetyltransferase